MTGYFVRIPCHDHAINYTDVKPCSTSEISDYGCECASNTQKRTKTYTKLSQKINSKKQSSEKAKWSLDQVYLPIWELGECSQYSDWLHAGWPRGPGRGKIFSFTCHSDCFWSPHSLLSNGHRGALYPRVKRPGRESDHSPPSSAEVMNTWIYTSSPSYAFMALCLIS
jgi:hypothetical protein